MYKTTSDTRMAYFVLLLLAPLAASHAAEPGGISLSEIPSPIIFRGDATTAYRDPAVIYHAGWFRLFFTLVKIEPGKRVFSCITRPKMESGLSDPRILRGGETGECSRWDRTCGPGLGGG